MARRKRKKNSKNRNEPVNFLTLIWQCGVLAAIYYYFVKPTIVLPVISIVFGIAIIWLAIKHINAYMLKTTQARKLQNQILRRRHYDFQSLDPYQLENHVASVINAFNGWSATATKGSGDQGADVVAVSPSSRRVVIQVKHQEARVTNKGVQEVVASKAIYQATEAVVFTSGLGYTKSAIELAKANGVRLWNVDDLIDLQEHAQNSLLPNPDILPH